MVSCWIIDSIIKIIDIFAHAVTSELENPLITIYIFHFFIKKIIFSLSFLYETGSFSVIFLLLNSLALSLKMKRSHIQVRFEIQIWLGLGTNQFVSAKDLFALFQLLSVLNQIVSTVIIIVLNCHKKGQNGPKATNTLSTPSLL
jgi:hypothetical protein